MSNEKLTDAEINEQATQLVDWELQGEMLYRQFFFEDFITAFEFMSKVAALAEQANHHPNWSNVYNKVDIALTTHEFNSVSQRDFDLAKKIDQL
jgi:4a-hydroxytetrahydrobiopterin dehydratase